METTHLGSGICSNNRRITGAILFVKVPATIIRSECRGLALNNIPNLSKSYLLIAACIISIAQQAKPKVNGHKEPPRAHPTIFLNLLKTQSILINIGLDLNFKRNPAF
jgi:hypothetical protein